MREKAKAKHILMSLTDEFKSKRIKEAVKRLEFETARPGEYVDVEEYRRITYEAFDELVSEGKIIYEPYKPLKLGPAVTKGTEIYGRSLLSTDYSQFEQRFLAQFAGNPAEKFRRKNMNITKAVAKAFPKTDDAVLVAKHFSFNEVESILLTSSEGFAAAILAAAQEKENEAKTA